MNKPKLRVTILGLNYIPESTGNAPYTARLAEGLSARGHDVTVVAGFPHYPEWKVRPGYLGWTIREVINGIRVKRLRHYVPSRPNGLTRLHMEISFGLRLLFASWDKPDVVILVSPALFSSGLAALRAKLGLRRPPVIVWVQDLYSRGIAETGGSSSRTAALMAVVEAWILRSAHKVVAIHERFARYLATELRVQESRVCVVRNWTHLPEAPRQDRAATRERLGWNDNEVVALHAGNMGKKQGLQNVVEAAKLAQTTGSRVKFVLMGDGNQRSSLEKAAVGITNIEFVDSLPQTEFQAALHAADLLLVNELPGVRDMSVPSKLTSYFSSGVPVIAATDEGSVTANEMTASGAGIRVDAEAPEALLTEIERLGSSPELAKSIGLNGVRFRNDTMSESAAIAKYDDLIKSLASSRGL